MTAKKISILLLLTILVAGCESHSPKQSLTATPTTADSNAIAIVPDTAPATTTPASQIANLTPAAAYTSPITEPPLAVSSTQVAVATSQPTPSPVTPLPSTFPSPSTAPSPAQHPAFNVKDLSTLATSQPTAPSKEAQTQATIVAGLHYLANAQATDGSWSLPNNTSPVAATSYALLAFLSAGQSPTAGTYAPTVNRAADYLAANLQITLPPVLEAVATQADPNAAADTAPAPATQPASLSDAPSEWTGSVYDQAIALRALCEVYKVKRSVPLASKIQLAANIAIRSQHENGGWRYRADSSDADISVTSSELLSLVTAKRLGFDIPQSVLTNAVNYIRTCQTQSGGFSYMPSDPQPGFARTAIALHALQVAGAKDTKALNAASTYLFDPRTTNDAQWNTYGSYYAAPAQHLIAGETSARWYAQSRDALLASAVIDDKDTIHWKSTTQFPPGDIFMTAVNITILATPYEHLLTSQNPALP